MNEYIVKDLLSGSVHIVVSKGVYQAMKRGKNGLVETLKF